MDSGVHGELRRDYTVKRVSLDADRIDDDVRVLLVIHRAA